jgi:hypothetical protein
LTIEAIDTLSLLCEGIRQNLYIEVLGSGNARYVHYPEITSLTGTFLRPDNLGLAEFKSPWVTEVCLHFQIDLPPLVQHFEIITKAVISATREQFFTVSRNPGLINVLARQTPPKPLIDR